MDWHGAITWLAAVSLGGILLRIAIVDLRDLRIPDRLSLPLVGAGLLVAALISRQPLAAHVAGAIVGYAVLAVVGTLHFKWRGREGLGLGDAKLFAAAGAWLGWLALPAVLLQAALIGLAFAGARRLCGYRTAEIPFGPALAVALWTTWLLGAPGVPIAWR